jgi:DNA-directed RNA polymerase subunit H (RpoH/RPB5)
MGRHNIETALFHVSDMLADRNDETASFREELENIPDWGVYLSEQMQHETNKTIVITAFTKTFVKNLSKNETIFAEGTKKNFIVVVQDSKMLSTANIQAFQQKDKELHAQGGMLQIFTLKELQYNPSKHILVPKHEKVREDQIKDIMTRYQVKTKSQLPVIMKTDMMARWLGLKHGDIVCITRHNENSGTYYYYRCCV